MKMDKQRYLIAIVGSDGYTWKITDIWNPNFARDCCTGFASTDSKHVWDYEALKSALRRLSMTENALSAVRVSTSVVENFRLKTSDTHLRANRSGRKEQGLPVSSTEDLIIPKVTQSAINCQTASIQMGKLAGWCTTLDRNKVQTSARIEAVLTEALSDVPCLNSA